MVTQTAGPKHWYAQKRIAQKVYLDLMGVVGSRGTVIENEPDYSLGIPNSSYSIINEAGKELGKVCVRSDVRYEGERLGVETGTGVDFLLLRDALHLLETKYSSENVERMKSSYHQERSGLQKALSEAVEALPAKTLGEISGLDHKIGHIENYVPGGNILSLYTIIKEPGNAGFVMDALSVDETGLETIRKKVEEHLGEKVLRIYNQLHD